MTLATSVAERAATFLGRRTSRRGFIARTAITGSALAVAGRRYVLQPGSAYAATCGCSGRTCDCGSLCCDGYTEFCCTIYGENACPPGSLLAGWWKVDGSRFCNGAARYYLDCNDQCGGCSCGSSGVCSGSCSGAACGCRSCGHRKDGCTHFRYGNCNNGVSCVGPIMCRVVTCSKPWELDPSCTTSARVDNATRNHHRSCLEPTPSQPSGSLTAVEPDGAGLRVRGTAVDGDTGVARVQIFIDREPVMIVAASGPGNSFDVSVAASPGPHEVCVYVQNVGPGESIRLGCRTVNRPPR